MTIKDCIDIVDNQKPNQYTIKDKVMWLSFLDETIINDVLKTHEGYDGRYDLFTGYSEDKLSETLIAPSPYDRLYTQYLKMKIDGENGETARYNNSMVLYNSYMQEYRRYYNKTHMPIDSVAKVIAKSATTTQMGVTDAQFEGLVKELTFVLTEHFSDTVSKDKISAVVNEFVLNNMAMIKGKDGYTPKKGVDYWNDQDKEDIKGELKEYSDENIKDIKKKVDLLYAKSLVKTISIRLLASDWVQDGDNQYSQIVSVSNITPYSKIDLQPTLEQLAIFYEKDITFVTENDNRVVTVYCIGQKPQNDYVMQATITEVER